MNPDHSRTKRRPADRPLPPARTLRGDTPAAPPTPAAGWIAPVRSGVEGPPIPPEPARSAGEAVVEGVPGLQPLAQPLAGGEPSLPIGTWTAVADDEAEAELVLEDEIWLSDPDAVVEELAHGDTIEPIEGLTAAGDVASTEPEPTPDEPPVSAWDLTTAVPPTGEEEDEQEAWERSGWEILNRAFPDATAEPYEAPVPAPAQTAPSGIPDADSETSATEPGDPTDLARRLEQLADRLRMHGSEALDESREAADPMEAALAAALTDLLAQRKD